MNSLIYVTGNAAKLRQAITTCEPLGISLEQAVLDIPEVQAEDGEPIARDKATKAFAQLQKPLIISDDNWLIPGLNNFPGPYMKSMNHWFSPEDWLHLTGNLADRTIILRQIVVYQDADTQKLFSVDITGTLLHEIRGESPHPHCTITSMDGGKTTMAEHHEKNESAVQQHSAWHDFAAWYAQNRA